MACGYRSGRGRRRVVGDSGVAQGWAVHVALIVGGLTILRCGGACGAAQLARKTGDSVLVVGPTIVALGTSAPEIAV